MSLMNESKICGSSIISAFDLQSLYVIAFGRSQSFEQCLVEKLIASSFVNKTF